MFPSHPTPSPAEFVSPPGGQRSPGRWSCCSLVPTLDPWPSLLQTRPAAPSKALPGSSPLDPNRLPQFPFKTWWAELYLPPAVSSNRPPGDRNGHFPQFGCPPSIVFALLAAASQGLLLCSGGGAPFSQGRFPGPHCPRMRTLCLISANLFDLL